VDVAGANVGRDAAVFVGCGGGRVGVLNWAGVVAWPNCACNVNAACVYIASGSSVSGALEGRLHAERMNMNRVPEIKKVRMNLDMIFSSI
jgi:hypothetical protein